MSRYVPKNPLRKDAKLDVAALVQSVDAFSHGIGVNVAAKAIGTSRKTVRGLYLEFRGHLQEPEFARWHRVNLMFPAIPALEQQVLVKAALFDLLAECHAQEACYRNYQAGRRASPVCRSCPLHGKFRTQERLEEAISLVHTVRDFYRRLNIHQEAGADPVALFRLRLIHTVTIATVVAHSRRKPSGHMLAAPKDFLSFGTFRELLVAKLLEAEQDVTSTGA